MGEREKYNLALLACALQPFFTSVYRFFVVVVVAIARFRPGDWVGLGCYWLYITFFSKKRKSIFTSLHLFFFILFYFILRTNNNRKKPTET
jgi:hypothetical protein